MFNDTLYLLGGFFAGICNATAGGGTLITFPLFIANGIHPIVANASNAVAVYPAHALASYGYRNVLIKNDLIRVKWLALSLMGAIVGAYLLTIIPKNSFDQLVPLLIAMATGLFAFSGQIKFLSQRHVMISHSNPTRFGDFLIFLFAIYGGFFGAGLGVMLMAGLMLVGVEDIQHNNALKNLLAAIITTVSVIIFSFSGLVDWRIVIPTLLGCVIGGLVGAKLAQRLNVIVLRYIIVSIGIILTVYYGLRIYH